MGFGKWIRSVVDPPVSRYRVDDDWAPWAAVTTALAFLVVFWLFYDLACRFLGQGEKGDTKVGIASRFERYIILVVTLLFNIPQVGIWLIAVLAHITALQRIFDVRRQAKEKNLIRYQ